MESSTTTPNVVIHERNSTTTLAASENASQASSLNEAANQFPLLALRIPLSQEPLTDQDEVSRIPSTSLHSVPEVQQHSASCQNDANVGLRDVQGYQNRLTSETDITTTPVHRTSGAGEDGGLGGAVSDPRASASQPSGRNIETCCEPLDPAGHPSLPITFSKAHPFRISYGMLLAVHFASQICIQVMMVLCVNGQFGPHGFVVAGVTLTLLVGLTLVSITIRVIYERKELHLCSNESA